MRHPKLLRVFVPFILFGVAVAGFGSAAALPSPLRVLTSDATGVTLRFELPPVQVADVKLPQGTFARIDAPGLDGNLAFEGRPPLPSQGALLGIPKDAIASVRVIEETTRDFTELGGRELEPLGRTEFVSDGKNLQPVRTFYRDPEWERSGAVWPAATVELEKVGGWRHQLVVPVRVQPFRVDPRTRRVTVVTSATIRVDFVSTGNRAGARAPGTDVFGGRATSLPARPDAWEGLYQRGLLNYEAARSFRIAPDEPLRRAAVRLNASGAGALGAPYDPLNEWSVRVDTTGIWRVTYAQLSAKGFPAGVPTAQLAFTRREWASGQVPPFVRIPVPIRVVEGTTGTAGTFDGDDAIVFYGQNFTDRAHPSEFRRRFSDADVFYLGVDAASGGARMTETTADLGLIGPVRPASFASLRRYEKRYFYTPTPDDTCGPYMSWTRPFENAEFSDSLTIWTPDVDATGQVRFRIRAMGTNSNPFTHTLQARWKRPSDNLLTSVATVTWGGKAVIDTDTTFAADRVASGTNKLEFRIMVPTTPQVSPTGGTIVFYEATYSRLFRAFQNKLAFNSGSAVGGTEIEVDGLQAASAPSVTVYDVTDSIAPVALVVPAGFVRSTGTSTWAARFQTNVASSGAPRRFEVGLANQDIPASAVALVSRVNGQPIWDPAGRPDYLIVTPEAFRAQAERLADHRRTQGFDVLVAPEAEVYDAFDGGRRSDWAIRRMLEYAFARWDSRIVLLFGDASDDSRNSLGVSSKDWIPSHAISGPIGSGLGQELSPSEFWYVADLANTTPPETPCTNAEPDLFPDMAIGRLPVGSTTQANGLVDKLIAYDTQDRQGAWRNKALIVPDDAYSYGSFFGEVTQEYCYNSSEVVFERISDNLENIIKNEAGFKDFNVEQFRLREKLASLNRPLPGDPDVCLPLVPDFFNVRNYVNSYTRPQFLDDLGQGSVLVNYQGHGSVVQLAHEQIFYSNGSAQDIDFVNNDGKPFFFLSFSCHVNQFSYYQEGVFGDGLGENMLIGPQNPLRPSAGAIGSYASTNYELLPSNPSGTTHLNIDIFRTMFVDPPSDPLHGESGARVLLGEALALGAVRFVANSFGLEKRAIQTYCLLGDPATPLVTGGPRLYATANDQAVTSGVRYQPGAQGDSVAFVLDLVDESRVDQLSLSVTGEGARPVDPAEYVVTPAFPDTANGGAGKRYDIRWNVRPQAKDADYTVTTVDRNGFSRTFTLPLKLEAALYANNQLVNNGDIAPSSGTYQYLVNSPMQLLPTDFDFKVDGAVPAGLTIVPAAVDSSRRLWVATWPAAFETGEHEVTVTLPGGAVRRTTFLTSNEARVALQNVFAFPSPFAEPPVTINFTLNSDRPANVAVKVYSVSGSLVWQRVESGVGPGYHQWIWDGTDAYGDALANGAYLYNVVAEDDRGLKAVERGKLARVR